MSATPVYFPTGLVTGEAFCNREEERKVLRKRFHQNTHVVLISPRRYGKSSLIAQFILEQKAPSYSIDLLPAVSAKYIKNAIVDGVTELLSQILPKTKKVREKVFSQFSGMNPVIELSALGQRVKLTPEEKQPEETIMKLLLNLDKAATIAKKQVIFVMDEFQQVSQLENSRAIEASVRHAVERSENIFYIFSGSNRTLLEAMFKNPDRPLYHLCDEIVLNRIQQQHYVPLIQKAAKSNWKNQLPERVVDLILNLTECHPYYVNRLCRRLWDQDILPEVEDVENTWGDYVESQKQAWVADVISGLSINQRAVLAVLAKSPEKEPKGHAFSTKSGIPVSSTQRTIATLLKHGYIYVDEDGYYQVLNPVIKMYLAKNKYF